MTVKKQGDIGHVSEQALKIAVVGAGIIGVASAEWLRRSGHQVTLIDRDQPGEATSFGNGGVLARCAIIPVPTPETVMKGPKMLLAPNEPLFLRWSYLPRLLPWLLPYLANARRDRVMEIAAALAPLLLDTAAQHRALASGTPAEKWLHDSDYIYLFRNQAAFEKDGFDWKLRHEQGIEGEIMTAGDLHDHDPHLGEAYRFGYRLDQHGYIANPGQYVKDLADWFTAQGGTFRRAEVDDIQPTETGAAIVSGGERHEFDRLVVATGAWSKKMSEKIGVRTKLETERGYHVEFSGPSNLPPGAPYMVTDGKFVATPMAAGLRLAGVVEFGGLDAGPSAAPTDILMHGLKRLYPDFTYESKSLWMGHRPCTVDSLPVLGSSVKSPHVYFAYGHQHIGLTAGAKTGRLLAQMISGTAPNLDMQLYSPDRF